MLTPCMCYHCLNVIIIAGQKNSNYIGFLMEFAFVKIKLLCVDHSILEIRLVYDDTACFPASLLIWFLDHRASRVCQVDCSIPFCRTFLIYILNQNRNKFEKKQNSYVKWNILLFTAVTMLFAPNMPSCKLALSLPCLGGDFMASPSPHICIYWYYGTCLSLPY